MKKQELKANSLFRAKEHLAFISLTSEASDISFYLL